MINLLCLLCSMCIQFAAIDIPTHINPNFMPSDAISMGFDYMRNSGGIWSYYSDVGLSESGIFITSYDYGNYFQIKYYVPVKPYISTVDSNFSLDRYTLLNDNYISGGLTLNGYSCYVYYYYKGNTSSNFGAQEWHNYNNQSLEFYYPVGYAWAVLAYTTSPLYYNNELVIVPLDYVEVPEDEGNYNSMGSLSSNGHSSDGNPLESLGGWSWASMTGHSSGGAVAPSPHSSSTHFNTTTQQPSANDSKTDNLLYMLGDKLADIIENTSSITSALGGVMYNVLQGASAIFNGISTFNDNVVNFASYLTSVPTSQDISDALDECENIGSLRDLSQSINIWSELGLTQVNSAPTYTFNFAGTMFDSMGNFTLNFNFLDSTKNLWQPLLIALLYFNLLVTILTGLPDLIQGRGET